ncbi:peptide ABC transporter substrate-binding protein [Dictyobacter formicarum]|uniref:Peptide ABC transporter substrate-binding protein n=1 Tax=Dictyobacter formicarum TaxID=2778368 RepID=A0ABQ3V8C2_9CHLR|nr:peptide ABC transporter substrate-binding protein [Dictyobacter formicarum]GHO82044.1 peptide ABC transporter substrate-binding protein [Dictyobacter formicarum]
MHKSVRNCSILLFSVLAMLSLFGSACGTNTRTAAKTSGIIAPESQQIFRWGILGSTDFTTLDPALATDAADVAAIQTIFTGLVQFNDKGDIKPQLAASYQVSPDGLMYTFNLKPNLKFSDGKPLTASDVAYSINRALDPKLQSPVSSYLSLIKDSDAMVTGKIKTLINDSLIVKDPQTIAIVIRQPVAYFLQTLAYPVSYVVEKSIVEKYGKNWTDHLNEGGGAGPFKVAKYSHTVGLDMVPNTEYYGAQPKLKQLEMHMTGQPEAAYNAYVSGQLDYSGIPNGKLDEALKRPDHVHVPVLALRMIQMNYLTKPFDNLKVRQAFDISLDRDLLAKTLFRGLVIPSNRFIPEGMYGANPAQVKGPDGTTSTAGNANMARKLLQEGLKEEGYSSVTALPTITFTETNATNSLKRANALIDQWKTVLGVNIKVNAVDAQTYSKLLHDNTGKTGLQMWDYAWQADFPDPHDWLNVFFGKGELQNNMNYGQNNSPMAKDQQAIQAELQKADYMLDKDARAKKYNELEQKLSTEAAWISMYQTAADAMLSPHVHGYSNNPLGVIDPEDWGDIYITQ